MRPSVRQHCLTAFTAALLTCAGLAQAETYPLVEGEDLVGQLVLVPVAADETLVDVAQKNGVGFRELLHANPGADAWLPDSSQPVLLPKRVVLPRGIRRGIVINVAEMRLYHFLPESAGTSRSVMIFPISVGRDDWQTPLGVTRVMARVRDPVWRPTAGIRAEHEAAGDPLPPAVPPGPDNPLGPLALRLALPSVLIHGTNRPLGIGMPVTHGCIRLAADHMRELFDSVSDGTPVIFIDEPYKLGRSEGQWFLEAHPVEGADPQTAPDRVRRLAQQAQITSPIEWSAVDQELRQPRGIPLAITLIAVGDAEIPPSGHRAP